MHSRGHASPLAAEHTPGLGVGGEALSEADAGNTSSSLFWSQFNHRSSRGPAWQSRAPLQLLLEVPQPPALVALVLPQVDAGRPRCAGSSTAAS